MPGALNFICEVCDEAIEGDPYVHPEEGDSYCWPCVVSMIGAERDEALAEVDRLRAAIIRQAKGKR